MAPDTLDKPVPPEQSEGSSGHLCGGRTAFLSALLFRRIVIYFLGTFVLAFGVAMMVKSDLGITPVNSIAYVTSRILSADHGLMTAIVYSGYVLLQLIILRREFRIFSFLQIPVVMVFGLFVSVCNRILSFPVPEAYGVRVLFSLGGVVVIGLGLFLYLRADLVPQPSEGLILAIQKKIPRWKLHNIKIGFDCSLIIIAAGISFIATGRLIGFREGSLISMIGIGKAMGFLSAHLGARVDALFRLKSG